MKDAINRMSRFCKSPSLGLVLIRLAVGMVFLAHGWSKIHNIPMVEGMMTGFGLSSWVGDFIAWLEVIGGIAMILGVLTRIFGVIFGIEMVVAYFLTGGFATGYHPHELELVLILLSFGLALTGSGRYSLYKMECNVCGAMCYADGEDCEKAKGKA